MNNLRNEERRLGEWLQEEILGEPPERAVLWPEQISLAQSLAEDAGAERVLSTSPGCPVLLYRDMENVYASTHTSHEVAEQIAGEADLEYGWALALDTIKSTEEGLSREEAMRKIADTSETLLEPEGHAVYNLESVGSRYGMPLNDELTASENTLEYAIDMMAILEEDYTDTAHLYKDPEFDTISPHIVWQKPRE